MLVGIYANGAFKSDGSQVTDLTFLKNNKPENTDIQIVDTDGENFNMIISTTYGKKSVSKMISSHDPEYQALVYDLIQKGIFASKDDFGNTLRSPNAIDFVATANTNAYNHNSTSMVKTLTDRDIQKTGDDLLKSGKIGEQSLGEPDNYLNYKLNWTIVPATLQGASHKVIVRATDRNGNPANIFNGDNNSKTNELKSSSMRELKQILGSAYNEPTVQQKATASSQSVIKPK